MKSRKLLLASLALLVLTLLPLAAVLYLALQAKGILPHGWPTFRLGGLDLAALKVDDLVKWLLDAFGRAGQTPSLGGVARMTASEFILETHQATPHLGPLYLFPSMDIGSANTAYIGHAAATAFVGLALGLARLLAGRLGTPAYALPLITWFWVVVDHGLFNHVAGTGRASGLVKFLYTIDAWGRLSSIVLYLVLGGTLVYERWVLWRYRERTRKYALDRDNLKLRKERAQGVLDVLAQVVDLRSYLRQRRGLTYALHVYHSTGRDQDSAGRERLHVLQFLAFLLARSKSRLEITPSLPLAES